MSGRSHKFSISTLLAIIGSAILLLVFFYQGWDAFRQPQTHASGNMFQDAINFVILGIGGLLANANTRAFMLFGFALIVISWLPFWHRRV